MTDKVKTYIEWCYSCERYEAWQSAELVAWSPALDAIRTVFSDAFVDNSAWNNFERTYQ